MVPVTLVVLGVADDAVPTLLLPLPEVSSLVPVAMAASRETIAVVVLVGVGLLSGLSQVNMQLCEFGLRPGPSFSTQHP